MRRAALSYPKPEPVNRAPGRKFSTRISAPWQPAGWRPPFRLSDFRSTTDARLADGCTVGEISGTRAEQPFGSGRRQSAQPGLPPHPKARQGCAPTVGPITMWVNSTTLHARRVVRRPMLDFLNANPSGSPASGVKPVQRSSPGSAAATISRTFSSFSGRSIPVSIPIACSMNTRSSVTILPGRARRERAAANAAPSEASSVVIPSSSPASAFASPSPRVLCRCSVVSYTPPRQPPSPCPSPSA